MTTRPSIHNLLHLYTPQLPNLGELANVLDTSTGFGLERQLYLINCADRLVVQANDGSTRLKLLDALTISLDGLTYRFTLKKGLSFHCGSEVTAQDAVDTIQWVLREEASASQLHRYVARDKSQRHGFAVYSISRYRFEVVLNQRLPDLLARLSLLEFSLRHAGKPCFSGPWRLAEQSTSGIGLALCGKHPDATASEYQYVRWEKIRAVPDIHAPSDQAFLYVYPGTEFKSPSEGMLADEICRPLEAGISILIEINDKADFINELRARLGLTVRACFGKESLWRRSPLHALVPESHVLHVPFVNEPPPAIDLTQRQRLRLDIRAASSGVPKNVWEAFCRIAGSDYALDIALADCEPSWTETTYAGEVRGVVHPICYVHPGDWYTPISQFARERDRLYADSLLRPNKTANVPRTMVAFVQNLTRNYSYVPFITVPFIIRSNRDLEPDEHSPLVRFTAVKPSCGQVRKAQRQEATLKALGAALQMFVHDVKRPFSMMQGVLNLIEASPGPRRIQEIAQRYLPDVRAAVAGVDQLIQDILEIGSDVEPAREDVSIRELIQHVLRELLALTNFPDIKFLYHFNHHQCLIADPQKIGRVLSNIIQNAVEAMQAKGVISFTTTEDPVNRLITITVGNTNSFIPEHLRADLFDRFFTEGKKRGTGLGLAIVKKIVEDHEGHVWCESDPDQGTRFIFTMPSSSRLDDIDVDLPADGSAICFHALTSQPSELIPNAGGGHTPEAAWNQKKVLLVDDDPIYMDMLQDLLAPQAARYIEFICVTSAEAALQKLDNADIHVAIIDVDLGLQTIDGLELVRQIRARNYNLRLCVHSNGSPFELQRRVLAAGADLFLPKPMSRAHLLRVLQAADTSTLPDQGQMQIALHRTSPANAKLTVVDDDAIILEAWEAIPGITALTFESPDALLAACDEDPNFLANMIAVVTDYTFTGSKHTGRSLAIDLARRSPQLAIFLATDYPIRESELPSVIRAVIPKDVEQAYKKLKAMVCF